MKICDPSSGLSWGLGAGGWGLVRRCGLECAVASTWIWYGLRLWLDGELVVNGWGGRGERGRGVVTLLKSRGRNHAPSEPALYYSDTFGLRVGSYGSETDTT